MNSLNNKTTKKQSGMLRLLGVLLVSAAFTCSVTARASTTPTITSVSVTNVTTPSAAFNFTVTGTNFVSASRRQRSTQVAVEHYGELSTTVNSATQLTVSVPALEAVTKPITLSLYVNTPGQGRSPIASDITFTINPPVQGPPPTLVSLSEASVNTPTQAFTFTVSGTNFVAPTAALPFHTQIVSAEWGELKTTVNSATQLTVNMRSLPKVKNPVVLHLYAINPDGTQSTTASELTFSINPPVPGTPPTLISLSAISVTTPARHVMFTVTGTGFVVGNGERNSTQVYSEEYGELETTANSATGLTVNLGAIRKVAAPIVLHLYVLNPDGTRSPASQDVAYTID